MLSSSRFHVKQLAKKGQDNVLILGAAGRDFHDAMSYWFLLPNTKVKAITAQQIPGINKRIFPPELCRNDENDNLYPHGVQIHPEEELESLISGMQVTTCALAYSDLKFETVQSLAARVNAAGAKFVQLPPILTMLESTKPVIAVCASRTGVGKSQTTRYIAKYLKSKGLKVVAVRHPMPYDKDLLSQRCQRYETYQDMDKYNCTIEEREEYDRHIASGTLLFAGVDYEMILREAEKEADVIIWDGGNNDSPFYKPDLLITLVDSLRPLDETGYYPGETNVRMADLIVIAKTNQLDSLQTAVQHEQKLREITKPDIPILFGASIVTPEARDPATNEALGEEEATAMVKGKRVLVIDDGPTLTHGGMAYGAGYVLAKNLGAKEIVDPRPIAKGTLKATFNKFTHLKSVIPAMGYGAEQVHDLRETIEAADCDTIVLGTPFDINRVMKLDKPLVIARYELSIPDHEVVLQEAINSVLDEFGLSFAAA
ncbi:hypothetical protein MPSEU_001036300 [Mayamaea pseudoterrestris]|nr:hypothetical protein MPSEU_001036300 [Mayamaea pseudoterrestris]